MKKYVRLSAFVIAMLQLRIVQACDVCGSAVNAGYFGILPQFTRHFAGVRYFNNSFNSKELPSLFERSEPQYTELLQRAEVYGRYYISNRIMLLASVPYQINFQHKANAKLINHGLGDASVLCNYIITNTGDSGNLNWRNTLSAGVGVKLPTGKFNSSMPASQQTGTGAFDYLFNAIYTTRYKKTGMNVDMNFRLAGNAKAYKYGNRFASGLRFFYWQRYKQLSFLPQAGVLIEYAGKDKKEAIVQKYTGGMGWYATVGADVYYKKMAFGFLVSKPLSEKINEGYTRTNKRITFQILYLF